MQEDSRTVRAAKILEGKNANCLLRGGKIDKITKQTIRYTPCDDLPINFIVEITADIHD